MSFRHALWVLGVLGLLLPAWTDPLPEWDFRRPGTTPVWTPLHTLQIEQDTDRGMVLNLRGEDPYCGSGPVSLPAEQTLWMEIEVRSEAGGLAQLFFAAPGSGFSEEHSVRFPIPKEVWSILKVPLPSLGPTCQLRLDPPGSSGRCDIRRIRFLPRPMLRPPAWEPPRPARTSSISPRVRSGPLQVVLGEGWGEFDVLVAGRRFAIGHNRSGVGYLSGDVLRWWVPEGRVSVRREGGAVRSVLLAQDPEGARWEFSLRLRPDGTQGAIHVESEVMVSDARSVVSLPVFGIHPGVGSFGGHKTQALFAGVEYLDDEDSSSDRTLRGPQARRVMPDSLKLTMPLMALAAEGQWLGMVWRPAPDLSALFDSPDRLFGSGGSLMALAYPGSDPSIREDGGVLPYTGQLLEPRKRHRWDVTLMGGTGNTIIPAVQEAVARMGLPKLGAPVADADSLWRSLALGWLDSGIREGDQFRHAVGPGFGLQPASDAAVHLRWLAPRLSDPGLRSRAEALSTQAAAAVPVGSLVSHQIGHLREPLPALVLGDLDPELRALREEGWSWVRRFDTQGVLTYQAPTGGIDYAATHDSRDANGMAAQAVGRILECGFFTGDRALITEGIRLLDAMARYRNTVPRGAQSWEIPLHAPDILASAHLVKAYTLGFEWTRRGEFLEQARYWAWTGVPFVYLQPSGLPSSAIGPYATTPVLGATQWIAPNWIGLPVQWCGLVFADAIRRLARHDPKGPWMRLADGIARCGVQQVHPATDVGLGGLLPDNFSLREQTRNPVPINPATLLPAAAPAYGLDPLYDWACIPERGLLIHAPGPIRRLVVEKLGVRFRAEGWPTSPWRVLVQGLPSPPRIWIQSKAVEIQPPHRFDSATGTLVLQLDRPADIRLSIE